MTHVGWRGGQPKALGVLLLGWCGRARRRADAVAVSVGAVLFGLAHAAGGAVSVVH